MNEQASPGGGHVTLHPDSAPIRRSGVRVKPEAFVPSLPTDPDVKLALIRFFGIARLHTISWQARPRTPRDTSPSDSEPHSSEATRPTRAEAVTGSESQPPPRWCTGDTRFPLRSTGAHGPNSFPGFPARALPAPTHRPAGFAQRLFRLVSGGAVRAIATTVG